MTKIRLMRIGDIPQVIRIANQSFYEWARYTLFFGKNMVEKMRDFPEWQFVAEERENVVGFVINELTQRGIHLCWIAVLPGYQGKEIGKKLLEEVEKKGKQEKKVRIYLDTPFARSFYIKYGFREEKVIYRLLKEISGKVIEKPEKMRILYLEDIKDIIPSLEEKTYSFLLAFFSSFPYEQEKIIGIENGNRWEGIVIGKTNEFSQEIVETRFLWGKEKIKALKSLEYIASTQGRKWIGVETESKEEAEEFKKSGYREEKNPLYWTEYHLLKPLF